MEKIDFEASTYAQKAMALFKEGYNCSQSVFLAFADKYDMDRSTALKLSSSFGGGMGRLREVCGAVSGAVMVLSMKYGYDDAKADKEKKALYKKVQEVLGGFESEVGSIICRELLNIKEKISDPTPAERNEKYYAKRPCAELVYISAKLTEDYINAN